MTKHIPPKGETMITHQASADCPCKPIRRSAPAKRGATGRFGKSQGYKQGEITYLHQPMSKEDES